MEKMTCPDCDTPMCYSEEFIHERLTICYWWCPKCDYQVEAERPGEEERVRY